VVALTLVLASAGALARTNMAYGATAGSTCQPASASLATVLAGAFSAPIGAWQAGDVPQPHPLPDGRVLWLLNDSFVNAAAPSGPITTASTFLHNVAIMQNATCFETLTGPISDGQPTSFLPTGETASSWWWFRGSVIVGAQLRLIVTRQAQTGPIGWGVAFAPSSTWVATYDWRTMRLVSLAPAGDAAVSPVYGFSIADDGIWTYLYGQADELRFPLGSTNNTVARVPHGQLATPPTYWDGSAWQADRTRAVSVSTNGTWNHRMRVVYTGERWLAVAKEDEFFGTVALVLEAPAPEGPWVIVARVPAPARTTDGSTSTYDAMVATAPVGDRIVLSWSNNAFAYEDVAIAPGLYRPSFTELVLPPPTQSSPVCRGAQTGRTATPPVPGAPSTFAATTPTRLVDTRLSQTGLPAPETVTVVDVTAAVGSPPAPVAPTAPPTPALGPIVAAVVNVTMTGTAGAGHVTVWPSGAARPLASNVNADRAGATVANLATVSVGADGKLALASNIATHLVVDLLGVYRAAVPPTPPAASTATTTATAPLAAGRFHALAPARLIDTRDGGASRLAPGSVLVVPVRGAGGVPVSGVGAVALTVTGTDAVADGFLTAWGSGDLPLVSSLNLTKGGTRANQVIVPLAPDGSVRIFTQQSAHLIVDVDGWFTDSSAPAGLDGRFVPVSPVRLIDSRAAVGRPAGSCTAAVGMPAEAIKLGATAAAINVTTDATTRPGFLTVWPAGVSQPLASNQNADAAEETRPVHALVAVGTGASFDVYQQHGGNLIIDLAGWFTGPDATPPTKA